MIDITFTAAHPHYHSYQEIVSLSWWEDKDFCEIDVNVHHCKILCDVCPELEIDYSRHLTVADTVEDLTVAKCHVAAKPRKIANSRLVPYCRKEELYKKFSHSRITYLPVPDTEALYTIAGFFRQSRNRRCEKCERLLERDFL